VARLGQTGGGKNEVSVAFDQTKLVISGSFDWILNNSEIDEIVDVVQILLGMQSKMHRQRQPV
jgi:hypothetical protein